MYRVVILALARLRKSLDPATRVCTSCFNRDRVCSWSHARICRIPQLITTSVIGNIHAGR